MLSGPPATAIAPPEVLLARFQAGTDRQRRSLVAELLKRWQELVPLIPGHLAPLERTGDDWAAGFLLQLLAARCTEAGVPMWPSLDECWLVTTSAVGIDYAPLQRELISQSFEEADRLTSRHLRELAGAAAVKRGYVYYSEVMEISSIDLDSMDRLWVCFSRGKFGFSVQGRLLKSLGGRWEKLWPRLGWKQQGRWTRYPGDFQWSIEAPEGHMPLVNQLRGVRLMDALLQHPALQRRISPPGS